MCGAVCSISLRLRGAPPGAGCGRATRRARRRRPCREVAARLCRLGGCQPRAARRRTHGISPRVSCRIRCKRRMRAHYPSNTTVRIRFLAADVGSSRCPDRFVGKDQPSQSAATAEPERVRCRRGNRVHGHAWGCGTRAREVPATGRCPRRTGKTRNPRA